MNRSTSFFDGTGSDERLSVAIHVDGVNFSKLEAIRNPKQGMFNKLIKTLSETAYPQTKSLRGKFVAVDMLLDAFIRHGRMPYDLFVWPEYRAAVSAKLELLKLEPRAHQTEVKIYSMSDAPEETRSQRQIQAWFLPIAHCPTHGGIDVAHAIRSNSTRPYPLATLFHGLATPSQFYTVFLQFILRPMLPCDSIICTSRASRDTARKIMEHLAHRLNEDNGSQCKYNGRFDIIPLGVDTSAFRPQDKSEVRSKLKLPKDTFILLYLGRISTLKADLFSFLQAFQWLVQNNPERKMLWVVAGTEDPGYTELLVLRARELGVANNIRIMLNISEDTKTDLLPASDIFVSPIDTLDESFGITPIEAMACGIPQVVPDFDGYRDTVSHGETGFLVPTYWADCYDDLPAKGIAFGGAYDMFCLGQSIAVDMRQTVKYIQCLMDNQDLYLEMAHQSRQRALKLYSFEVIVKQYEELWIELASIASCLTPKINPVGFDQPPYFKLFEHYASAALTDGTTLRLTTLGKKAASDISFPPPSLLSITPNILDPTLLQRALIEISNYPEGGVKHSAAEQPVNSNIFQMGVLTRLLEANGNCHPDYVRRHIMWLVKYLYIEPVFN